MQKTQDAKRKCKNCKWEAYCGGLSDDRRLACTEYKPGNCDAEWEREVSRRWGEMSYYQRSDPRNTPSMQERLRSGE